MAKLADAIDSARQHSISKSIVRKDVSVRVRLPLLESVCLTPTRTS
jgi:hypothetical protein